MRWRGTCEARSSDGHAARQTRTACQLVEGARGGTKPAIMWAMFGVLVEGARLASERLWRL